MGIMFGVDVGGTFTDLSIFDTRNGRLASYKLSSTPSDPSKAIVEGITDVLDFLKIQPNDISYLAHGTTVATNALIEKKGARVGLITTAGFKDMMEIGWQKRPHLYDLHRPKATRIIPHGFEREVPERILYNGEVYISLDEDEVRKVVRDLRKMGAESIAICFLFSFINPVHECRVKSIVQEEFPEAYVSASNELVHEFREYPRMSTTVLNAYLGPVMEKYVHNFEKSMSNIGVKVSPFVTQSNGSIISISETIDCPIKTAVSGPSAGVVGAASLGRLCGINDIITFDMGGTSADISLIKDGKTQLSSERLVEGYPVRIPMIDIVTIGAGGGSIARIDEGNALKVGPESAGATPGPACYNRGGKLPTVTDANIILGKLNQNRILDGRMEVKYELAKEAIQTEICDKSSLSLEDAAMGIISVVNSNMMRAVRVVSVERGYDPREFVLMAFGGAGPLHACEMARELGINKVMIPSTPGTLCSFGLLMADAKFDLSRSNIMLAIRDNLKFINSIFTNLRIEGDALLDKEEIQRDKRNYSRSVDARYEHQNYEINIPIPDGELTEASLAEVFEVFHATHKKNFGYSNAQFRIQFVNFRLSAVGEIEKPEFQAKPIASNMRMLLPLEMRRVLFSGEREHIETPVYHRDSFGHGCKLSGPLIIDQMDTTVAVPPKWELFVDGYLNLQLTYIGEK